MSSRARRILQMTRNVNLSHYEDAKRTSGEQKIYTEVAPAQEKNVNNTPNETTAENKITLLRNKKKITGSTEEKNIKDTTAEEERDTKDTSSAERNLNDTPTEEINFNNTPAETPAENKITLLRNNKKITSSNLISTYNDSESEDKSSGSEYLPSDDYSGVRKKVKYQTIFDDDTYSSTDESSLNFEGEISRCKKKKDNKRQRDCLSNNKIILTNENEVTSTVPELEATAGYANSSDVPENNTIGPDSTSSSRNRSENVTISIDIVSAKKKCDGKRLRDKQHSCYFCHKLNQNMARHFETVHANTTEVAKILAMPKASLLRKNAFAELIKCGDFYHNCNVLETKMGELILVRRPTQHAINSVSYSDFGPCPHCLGFVLKKHLWHHIKIKCSKRNTNDREMTNNRHVISESVAILNNTFGRSFSNEYIANIVSSLRQDEIGQIAAEDNLIVRFGAMQYDKYGTTQNELIRQNMRQLARLKQKVKEVDSSINQLRDSITPTKFDVIVQATKILCNKTNTNITSRPDFGIPSLALKIGYSLKKCAAIESGIALRNEDLSKDQKINAFLNLMEMEWAIRISSNALNSLYTKKMNSEQLLPITSDLVTLTNYLSREIRQIKTEVSSAVLPQSWANLASLTLCRIILFNKRRSGETSKITLNSFHNRPSWTNQTTEELKNSLTPVEKKLAESHTVIEVPGKWGRKVPVILTEETMHCIDILNRNRKNAGISELNPYIFARSNNSPSYLRGHDCLRKHCAEANLTNPGLITGTKLRKYIATVCQVMNLEETEYDWLARHLGHDIRVHREFYRLHESAVELTKISRLLQVVENGEVAKFAGKPLRDININELPNIEEELDDSGNSDEDDVENNKEDDKLFEPLPTKTKPIVLRRRSKVPKRKAWSTEEKSAVLSFFRVNVKNGIVPSKELCEECAEKYPILKERKWTDIKFCVKNSITKRKKIMKT